MCGAVLLAAAASGAAHGQAQTLPPGTSLPDPATAETASDGTATLRKAEEAMQHERWADAASLLQTVVQHRPADAQAWYDLGFCRDALDDVAGAKTAYQRAMLADPQGVSAAVSLGLLLARSGDAAAATEALTRAVALQGDGSSATTAARAQAYRALARLRLPSDPGASRDALIEALRLTPESADDTQLAGEIAEALHDDAAAASAYARVAKASPNDPHAAAQYARVLARQGKTADALDVLNTALAAHADEEALLAEKASVLLQAKEVAPAIPLLERLHTAHPEPATTRLLAEAYAAQGEPARADPLFQEAAAATPADGSVLAEWAETLMRQQRSAQAQALLERAVALHFSSPADRAQAALLLAFAASANHRPETVVKAISIRNEDLPMNATSAFLLATARDTLHQSREAAGAYRQFLELAQGQYPEEESQAKQRLGALSRAK